MRMMKFCATAAAAVLGACLMTSVAGAAEDYSVAPLVKGLKAAPASVLLVGSQQYTGGSNGLTDFDTILGAPLASSATKVALYYVTLAVLVAVFALCFFLVNRRIGKIFMAIL